MIFLRCLFNYLFNHLKLPVNRDNVSKSIFQSQTGKFDISNITVTLSEH